MSPAGPPIDIIRGWAASIPAELALKGIPWARYTVTMYDRTFPRPRWECWFHDDPRRTYTFGGGDPIVPVAIEDNALVRVVRRRLAERGYGEFDSCFGNRYDDGSHSISWHADDERWIGPVIASVTFGAVRKFKMKPKPGHEGEPVDLLLEHGDLLIMRAGCQDRWLHCVPKTKKDVGCRVNLTFRQTRGVP